MLWLLMWVFYGLIVGLIAKAIHRGPDPTGFLPTIGIGVVGSFIGGFINFILGKGNPFQTSGLAMGIVGGVIACFLYRKFKLDQYLETQALKDQIEALSVEVDALSHQEPRSNEEI